MNIRVDLTTPIRDGMEVKFRSPEDCSQVTGLIVYSGNESQEFMFADAHGENVGDIDHLFAEGAVVKVILDVATSKAFVQNADTNAYIERTFIKTVNGVGPDENGNVSVSGGGTGGDIDLSEYATKEEMQTMYEDLTINDNEAINKAESAMSRAEEAYSAAENASTTANEARNSADSLGTYVDEVESRVSDLENTYVSTYGLESILSSKMYATKSYVNEQLGDVESALDAIIAMQSNLIGGDA